MDAASSTQGGTPPAVKVARTGRGNQAFSSKIARDSDTQKYKIKYKDLKVKVREIERDNDKLALRLLKAQRDIQRVRLERAIIFERLAIPVESEPPARSPSPALAPAPSAASPVRDFLPVTSSGPTGPARGPTDYHSPNVPVGEGPPSPSGPPRALSGRDFPS